MNAKTPTRNQSLIITSVIMIILVVGGFLIYLAKSDDDFKLKDWGHTQGDFVGLVERAYGEDSNHSHFDAQVDYYITTANTACEDLRINHSVDFYNLIMKSDRDRLIVTGGVLAFCSSLQERSIEFGLRTSDFEKFPLE